ncbi:uncharacterized protein LOC143219109 isoform X2 [Lasioglossum baleicum]|uniref:uncharacterized protein LOC143219109 isoform X2 n=1 Tax=Lasioglossum baleicum TaxID=434251 RepID=UPI003FCE5B81
MRQQISSRARTRHQVLQMRSVQRGNRQHHAVHQLHCSHAFEGLSALGRMVHQIRERGIDSARLRADLRREGGLEHEDVLLPARRLQLRPVVDVQQHRGILRDRDDGSPRRADPSWLIRR